MSGLTVPRSHLGLGKCASVISRPTYGIRRGCYATISFLSLPVFISSANASIPSCRKGVFYKLAITEMYSTITSGIVV